jgi:uncharacterized repeat protein (TIGR03803 family)
MTPTGVLTRLADFPPDSFAPLAGNGTVPFLQAGDGNFYGVTTARGAHRAGTAYRITPAGQYTLLYSFTNGTPTALIVGGDGNLYGATEYSGRYGALFRLTSSGEYTLLHEMARDDGACPCQLTQGSDGVIYGTAEFGGSGQGGTIFALDAGLPIPAPQLLRFNPKSGAVGTRVLLWGRDLLSATVQFNGVASATVSNSGPNYVDYCSSGRYHRAGHRHHARRRKHDPKQLYSATTKVTKKLARVLTSVTGPYKSAARSG